MNDVALAEIFDGIVTYHDKCSICSFPTTEIDLPALYGRKICFQCLLTRFGLAITPAMANLEYDLDEATNQLEVCEAGNTKLEAEAEDLRSTIEDLEIELSSSQRLVEAATNECDALRKRVDEFEDDKIALQNDNARMKLDMDKLKERTAKHAQL